MAPQVTHFPSHGCSVARWESFVEPPGGVSPSIHSDRSSSLSSSGSQRFKRSALIAVCGNSVHLTKTAQGLGKRPDILMKPELVPLESRQTNSSERKEDLAASKSLRE